MAKGADTISSLKQVLQPLYRIKQSFILNYQIVKKIVNGYKK